MVHNRQRKHPDSSHRDRPDPGDVPGGSSRPARALPLRAGLESFLGLSAGTLSGLGNGPVIDGSAIKQTLSLAAGDQISFDADSLTNESPGPTNRLNDFGFFSLSGPGINTASTLASVTSPGLSSAPPGTGFAFQSRSSSFAPFVATTAGTYTIGFGAVDVGPFVGRTSGLLVDNVLVPEPAGLMLLGIGIAGVLGFSRCYRWGTTD